MQDFTTKSRGQNNNNKNNKHNTPTSHTCTSSLTAQLLRMVRSYQEEEQRKSLLADILSLYRAYYETEFNRLFLITEELLWNLLEGTMTFL